MVVGSHDVLGIFESPKNENNKMNEDQQKERLAAMLKRNLPALMKIKGEWLLMYQQGDQYVVQRVESEEHGKAILAEISLPNETSPSVDANEMKS